MSPGFTGAQNARLNAFQAEAASHVRGPLLVFAGAGSGKTRVITYRIANMVACERVPPYRILAVTFTNKAAAEMRSRLEQLLSPSIARDLWVGTFHATCAKLLRAHGHAVGVPKNFVIYDSSDQKAVVTRALRELDLDEKRYAPRAVLSRIHKEKQEGRGPEEMSLDSYMDDAIRRVYARYEEQLRAAGAVDFEDLIVLTLRLLRDTPEGVAVRRRFEYVLVDEFQDTNHTQYALLRALVTDHRNLAVVGDDDQSIYRWRGADVRNIRGFKKDFPEALVVKLEQNYRSSGRIVDSALGVIAPSREREPKELWTENEPGEMVDVVAVRDERDEAAHVLRVVEEARKAGVPLSEMAVFYRIHAQSRVLEEALRGANLPYQIVGGTKFYERAEVKDAIAYLRVLVNPKSDVDFLRIINTPARGIGSTTLERLSSWASANRKSVAEALAAAETIPELGPAPKKKLVAFRTLLAELTKASVDPEMRPAAMLRKILDDTGYLTTLRQENTAESDARIENLEELVSSLVDFEVEAEAEGVAATLEGYLERVSLQADVDSLETTQKIVLMTVHGAKGLEFEVVVLTGMEEELFPYRSPDPSRNEDDEEERRLAYVAITRAKKKLVMTHASMRQLFGMTRWGRPSRFISDLPQDHVQNLGTRAMLAGRESFVDRPSRYSSAPPVPSGGAWSHPQRPASRPEPARDPGERYVDTEFFDDASSHDDGGEAQLRRGSRVVHARFGEGEVRKVESSAEPTVVAFFPGWGEKKILARFLRLA
ncbi:MAG: UvrD-helicase domain-containing protein [Polyangiaceae bacterium]